MRLLVLLLLFGALSYSRYAYLAHDPDEGPALDRSEARPEGIGLAPAPARGRVKLEAAYGRWLHAWLDELLGGKPPKPRDPNEIRVLADAVERGAPGSLVVRVREHDGSPAPGTLVTRYARRGAKAPGTLETSAAGEVRFDGLASGPGYVVDVHVNAQPFVISSSPRIGVQIETGTVRQLDVALPSGFLEGQVVDGATGAPC